MRVKQHSTKWEVEVDYFGELDLIHTVQRLRAYARRMTCPMNEGSNEGSVKDFQEIKNKIRRTCHASHLAQVITLYLFH